MENHDLQQFLEIIKIKAIKLDVTDSIIFLLKQEDMTAEENQKFNVQTLVYEFDIEITPNFKETQDGKEIEFIKCNSWNIETFIKDCEIDFNLDIILNSFIY